MKHIHAANHGRCVQEGQIVHGPRHAAHFGIHLNKHLRNDRPQILASLDGTRQDHLRRNWVLFKQESLHVIIQLTTLFGSRQNEYHKLNAFVELILEGPFPVVEANRLPNLDQIGVGVVVAALLQTLLHGALELIGNLTVAIAMENAPRFQRWLCEHLPLNLAIQFSRIRLNIEAVGGSRRASSHKEFARLIFEALQFLRILLELQMPELLLLNTLRVVLEMCHQVLDLLDFGFGVGMDNLGQILHQSKV